MKLNRRKFLGMLGAAPVVGAVVASSVRAEPESPELVEVGKLPDGTAFATVGDNGELLQSLDGVTWIDKRGGVSFNDFDIVPMSPFPEVEP